MALIVVHMYMITKKKKLLLIYLTTLSIRPQHFHHCGTTNKVINYSYDFVNKHTCKQPIAVLHFRKSWPISIVENYVSPRP